MNKQIKEYGHHSRLIKNEGVHRVWTLTCFKYWHRNGNNGTLEENIFCMKVIKFTKVTKDASSTIMKEMVRAKVGIN